MKLNDIVIDYKNIIEPFLSNNISIQKFILTYLEFFKKEKRQCGDELYYVLEELFENADMCTSNKYLLLKYPENYIDEKTLRKKANETLQKLNKLYDAK
jgi:hypothetical protein